MRLERLTVRLEANRWHAASNSGAVGHATARAATGRIVSAWAVWSRLRTKILVPFRASTAVSNRPAPPDSILQFILPDNTVQPSIALETLSPAATAGETRSSIH